MLCKLYVVLRTFNYAAYSLPTDVYLTHYSLNLFFMLNNYAFKKPSIKVTTT